MRSNRLPASAVAVALDESIVPRESWASWIGSDRQQVDLSSNLIPNIIGGIVLRVLELDPHASSQNRLNQLRKQDLAA